MTNIITADYNGTQVFFQDDAYLNATAIAKHFNKLPNEWLRLDSTQEYIDLLCKNLNTEKSRILKTTRGVSGGTWLHRRLAVPFARWLNVEFAIWCDEQIEKILIDKNQPKQLALPEPSKMYQRDLTEKEMQDFCWAWYALRNYIELTDKLQKQFGGFGGDYARAIRQLNERYGNLPQEMLPTLQRITTEFNQDITHGNGWNRIIYNVRHPNAIIRSGGLVHLF
ncbi:hypothetical protein BKK47_05410 [Rodentibacter mrazii]|uniref:KilA-N domain-containing protein n=1 Tax=Rodentibacter mrazii TaxID=1908257 RepID=A0A1V3IG30_9PAST|nr:KilA-N domain-containing protein [Rodentibacter mrazii]OOF39973.1 hypothetical protein BKK47_05410 [Rodentibacter mrazii]